MGWDFLGISHTTDPVPSQGRSQEYPIPWDIPLRSHTISLSWDGIPPLYPIPIPFYGTVGMVYPVGYSISFRSLVGGFPDVGRIALKILPNIAITLSSILSELRCHFQNLHTAGNDAYFTLRVLLLLAIRGTPA